MKWEVKRTVTLQSESHPLLSLSLSPLHLHNFRLQCLPDMGDAVEARHKTGRESHLDLRGMRTTTCETDGCICTLSSLHPSDGQCTRVVYLLFIAAIRPSSKEIQRIGTRPPSEGGRGAVVDDLIRRLG